MNEDKEGKIMERSHQQVLNENENCLLIISDD
jgi:hypothetical protein